MPVVDFHLLEGRYSLALQQRLVVEAGRRYAEVLGAPLDRVRAIVTLHRPELTVVGGELLTGQSPGAPYFTFVVLEGRPVEQRQRLLVGFTDLIVDILGAPRDLVRGHCLRVEPEDWAIGGVPASVRREREVRARAEGAEPSAAHTDRLRDGEP